MLGKVVATVMTSLYMRESRQVLKLNTMQMKIH